MNPKHRQHDKGKIIKEAREKRRITNRIKNKNETHFLLETTQVKIQLNIFKEKSQCRILLYIQQNSFYK